MRAAYWLAFALASIPYFGYLVGMTFIGPLFSGDHFPSKRRGFPIWLAFLLSLAAFAYAIWQQVSISLFFDAIPNYPNYERVTAQEAFGVMIPVELGRTVNSFVSSAFYALLMASVVASMVIPLFRSRSQPQRDQPVPRWASYIISLGLSGLIVWSGWYFFASAVRDWQALF